ncbi:MULTISPECIES: hypothetical protein [Providencia]|uniref:Uncharacterized protein n=1 Tax=Providencia stuartii TaxID=588 RepID=A0AAI9GJ40_PROST|nr:hypothetical protein [Providencia stuartii]ELR5115272.1 hypothetical protein [Providencia stuartii]
MARPLASLTIENFWNEDIKEMKYVCYQDTLPISSEIFYNIKQKQIIPNAHLFSLYTETNSFWKIKFTTVSGAHWFTPNRLKCDDFKEDNSQVTIGINGDAKTMYVAFPSSKSCSIQLVKSN